MLDSRKNYSGKTKQNILRSNYTKRYPAFDTVLQLVVQIVL